MCKPVSSTYEYGFRFQHKRAYRLPAALFSTYDYSNPIRIGAGLALDYPFTSTMWLTFIDSDFDLNLRSTPTWLEGVLPASLHSRIMWIGSMDI